MFRFIALSNSRPRFALAGLGAAALLVAAGCSSSGTKASTSTSTTAAPSSSASPSKMFSTANVSGLGTVVVDGRGRTVYVLTADGHSNATCDDASGCSKVWPDLPLPDGVSGATAGTGVDSSKLGTMKLSDGETYPTYNGWLMYEFVQDTAAGQGHGEGIKSFGGTWYTLNAAGSLVMAAASTSASSTSGNGY